MKPFQWKTCAVALLMAAIAALALAMHASSRKVHILGPSALVGLPDGSVWLGVGRELWHLNAEGELRKKAPGDLGGLSMPPANLVRHPDGSLVVSYRGDANLYWLDPETAQVRRRLQPQWPAALVDHSNRAITLAFAGDGRLAISTGGGHAVALFDPEGRFLARTAQGTYQFTNGLWWTDSSLWTTDTNRFDLVELNPADLTERQRVHLQDSQLPGTYLGQAIPPGPVRDAAAPLATVVRLLNGMELGHVADVLPDGTQQAFPTPEGFEPRGLHWRANDLLVVDGTSWRVWRLDPQHRALTPFGSPAVQRELEGLREERANLEQRYRLGLFAAVVLFSFGFGAAVWAQRLETRLQAPAAGRDLSRLGTTPLSTWQVVRASLRLEWWLWAFLPAYFLLDAIRSHLSDASAIHGTWPHQVATVMLLFVKLGLGVSLLVVARRRMLDPRWESIGNQAAVARLRKAPGFWDALHTTEHVQETLLAGQQGSAQQQWLVLSNERLFLHAINARDHSLIDALPRSQVVRCRVVPAKQWKLSAKIWPRHELHIEFRSGESWRLDVSSPVVVARRISDLLSLARSRVPDAASNTRVSYPTRPHGPNNPAVYGTAWQQVLASLLIPGLGQWMQRRRGTALLLFCIWLLVCVGIAIPVLWTLKGPKAAVDAMTLFLSLLLYLFPPVVAARDAWNLRRRAG